MANFKSSVEHNTGATIVEDGVTKEIIALDPLYLVENETMPYCVSKAGAVLDINTLSTDPMYEGYHVSTVAELNAIHQLLCKDYEENPYPETGIQARGYNYWKPAEEIPGNITGPEYCRTILGINFDGFLIASQDEEGNEILTPTAVGDGNTFWTSDTINSTMFRVGVFSAQYGMSVQLKWGASIEQSARYSILMIKNRD